MRLPGDYRVLSAGVDTELFRPAEKANLVVFEWRPGERALHRAVTRALRQLPGWELVLLRTKPLAGRPTISRSLRGRAHVRTLRDGPARSLLLNRTAIFVPGFDGLDRVRLEARAAGAAVVSPPGVKEQPELAAAEVDAPGGGRDLPRERGATRARRRPRARVSPPWRRSWTRSTAASPEGARRRVPASWTPSPAATGSSPTFTCTRRGRTIARSRWKTCSTTRRPRGWARSPSPITTSSAARSRRPSSPATAT